MRQFNEIFKTLLGKNTLEKIERHHDLYTKWEQIVRESFVSKKDIYDLNAYNNGAYISKEREEMISLIKINQANGGKAADHSAIKCVKNNTLYVESDHQGWIQILQTKQHIIIKLVNKEFPDLGINAILFVLSGGHIAKTPSETECAAETSPPASEPPINMSAETPDFEDAISAVQDKDFRELLRKLRKKTVGSD